MKTALFAFVLALVAIESRASIDWDGCYQLYLPNAMYPAFCLKGTNEEGIGGASARIVFFGTNTDKISGCGLSSSLNSYTNSFEFIANASKQLILSEAEFVNSSLEGNATVGRTKLKFFKLDFRTSKRLLAKFYAEPRCQNLSSGEITP